MFKNFKEIAKKYPNKVAIVSSDKSFTYSEILEYIVNISKNFQEKNKAGIIFLPKNEYSIIFQLALNFSGNIFTPIDIKTPIDRVKEIINQLNPEWIITSQSFDGYFPLKKFDNFSILKSSNGKVYNKDVSHIYFSSGSTGLPKGILLSEKPAIEVVLEQAKIINMQPGKKFAWLLSPSFDASLSDIYLTLLSGGELHICDFPQNKIKTLLNYLKNNQITHTDISPSILPFVKVDELYLESVIFGGEIGNENVVKNLAKKVNMYNAYGPTETTICSSLKKVDNNWTASNIGVPLSGVEYTIINNELYISGSHLCVGYLNDNLNQSKFCQIDGKRFYKTGDLVNKKDDEYFYKGRTDRQFKHHGVLISPEEIENWSRKAGCNEAKCENKEKFTLYYQGEINEKDLRIFLESKMNKNMIPSLIIKLDEFKTNINGKTIL